MTQFNKGPAYGLSAEVKNKVTFFYFLSFLTLLKHLRYVDKWVCVYVLFNGSDIQECYFWVLGFKKKGLI